MLHLASSVKFWLFNRPPPATNKRCDILIISHLTSIHQLSNGEVSDYYFGQLHDTLSAAGLQCHTLYINHLNSNPKLLFLSDPSACILPKYNSPITELLHLIHLFSASISVNGCAKNADEKHLLRTARLAQFNSLALSNIRIGKAIFAFAIKMRVKAVIHTSEGHGWERVADLLLHKHLPNIKICGYQHAAIPHGPRSLDISHGDNSLPDHYFVTGKEQLKIIKSKNSDIDIECSIIGKPNLNRPLLFSGDNPACLVAPEGLENETLMMFGFALDAAILAPKQRFIFRLHPIISRRWLSNAVMTKRNIPKNLELSDRVIQDDISQSRWVCYRGSAVAIQGLAAGLRPVFISEDMLDLNNNPIPSSVDFQKLVNSPSDLLKIIADDRKNGFVNDNIKIKAIQFAIDYFEDFQPNHVLDYLKKNVV